MLLLTKPIFSPCPRSKPSMAKMLDGPVPAGARSVSWPWYHHVLQDELTPDARTLLETYSKIRPDEVESHIYRMASNTTQPHIALH